MLEENLRDLRLQVEIAAFACYMRKGIAPEALGHPQPIEYLVGSLYKLPALGVRKAIQLLLSTGRPVVADQKIKDAAQVIEDFGVPRDSWMLVEE